MEKIEQSHREEAAAKIKGDSAKDDGIREMILAGQADDHPLVRAAAFYAAETEIQLIYQGEPLAYKTKARLTTNGNYSFEFQGQRHILKPDGQILQMIRYAFGAPSWEPSPVLVLGEPA